MSLGIVVIVDDEEMIINPITRLLTRLFNKENLDYQVMASVSPTEVLQQIEGTDTELALVISDIMMEAMNGVEFLHAIRKRFPDTLLMVLTGYADQHSFTELNERLELFSYQEKPWDNRQFERTVKNALNLFRRKKLLSRYVPEEIVERVLMRPDNEVLEGVELEATIMFLDFRDSTTLYSSDTMGPKKALRHLNTYFEALVAVLERYDGILDKFMGDGFMALFGVPYPSQNPAREAQNAVLAALEMRQVVHDLNTRFKETPLSFGIGISTGTVIAGNVGTRHRLNYTVLGSAVNVASRLEKAAKPFPDGILISPSTYDYVKETVTTRPHPISLAGGERQITAYELLAKQ